MTTKSPQLNKKNDLTRNYINHLGFLMLGFISIPLAWGLVLNNYIALTYANVFSMMFVSVIFFVISFIFFLRK